MVNILQTIKDACKYIFDTPIQSVANLIISLSGGIILAILGWIAKRFVGKKPERDRRIELFLIIVLAIIVAIVVLSSVLNNSGGNGWQSLIAFFIGVLITLGVVKIISSFKRRAKPDISAAPVPQHDTADVETVDVRITGQIQDSWNEIIAAIDDGTAQWRYAIGAYKPLNLGQFGVINMQLAGINRDDRADGSGKAATTWIAKEILPETHRWNPRWDDDKEGTSTIGGWEKCELRKWMNESVRPAIPENVRGRLVSVKKSQEWRDKNWNLIHQTTEDRIWIPSYDEVFGEQSLYYGLFRNQRDRRIKTLDGSAAWWWLRSANNYNVASSVYIDGSNGSGYVYDTSGGLALGFCL